MLPTGSLENAAPIHCTPLPLHPPLLDTQVCVMHGHLQKGEELRALRAVEDGQQTMKERGFKRGEVAVLVARASALAVLVVAEESAKVIEEPPPALGDDEGGTRRG